jgi:glycosyltransferase involved in cell wall biosynthesis
MPYASAMDLLYVTEGIPTRDPLSGDGSSMISYEVIRRLPDDLRITLVTFGSGEPVPDEVRDRCDRVVTVPLHDSRWDHARSMLLGRPLGTLRLARRSTARLIESLSRRADVTLLHGPHSASLIGAVRGPVVLQVVDPWSFRAAMETEGSTGLRHLYRSWRAGRSLQVERAFPRRARLLTVGRRDAEAWSARLGRPVGHIRNGVDVHEAAAVRPPDGAPTACFVGSLDYGPNIASAEILVREIAPRLWGALPETRFVIAGRHPTPAVLALADGLVEVRGDVPSVVDVFREADVAIFPDRQGLGVRNSVSEALAAGVTVVATSVAGREQPENPRLHIADDVEGLVALLQDALTRPRRTPDPVTAPPLRDWDSAAREYHHELLLAVTDGRT